MILGIVCLTFANAIAQPGDPDGCDPDVWRLNVPATTIIVGNEQAPGEFNSVIKMTNGASDYSAQIVTLKFTRTYGSSNPTWLKVNGQTVSFSGSVGTVAVTLGASSGGVSANMQLTASSGGYFNAHYSVEVTAFTDGSSNPITYCNVVKSLIVQGAML